MVFKAARAANLAGESTELRHVPFGYRRKVGRKVDKYGRSLVYRRKEGRKVDK